ncbi:U4/U6.U5 tri-snRNP-associated protein 1-like [Schistocerca gregaria]|uniref:U4/U6.U5 tri-snRNP-associated protein 1-like n=1 Tax=Schistocerca gregaria TaxID=7010 RepID=UPI00211F182C|nr:U4/U6.U5 tri-snRNP-associated protein 1-like [Schistocerca gregaria]
MSYGRGAIEDGEIEEGELLEEGSRDGYGGGVRRQGESSHHYQNGSDRTREAYRRRSKGGNGDAGMVHYSSRSFSPERSSSHYHHSRRSYANHKELEGGGDTRASSYGGHVSHRRERDSNTAVMEKRSRAYGTGLRDLSVSEMNALRLSLGLSPLDVTEGTVQSSAANKQSEEKGEERQLTTIERLALAKERRMDRLRKQQQRMQAGGMESDRVARVLGDSDEEQPDTVDWVIRHRQIMMEKKLAEEREKEFETIERQELGEPGEDVRPAAKGEGGSHRAIRVAHDLESLPSEETILVIKDQPILNKKGQPNEEEDELQNLGIAMAEKRRELQEKKRKAAKLDPFDTYEDGDHKKELEPVRDEKGKHLMSRVEKDAQIEEKMLEEIRERQSKYQKYQNAVRRAKEGLREEVYQGDQIVIGDEMDVDEGTGMPSIERTRVEEIADRVTKNRDENVIREEPFTDEIVYSNEMDFTVMLPDEMREEESGMSVYYSSMSSVGEIELDEQESGAAPQIVVGRKRELGGAEEDRHKAEGDAQKARKKRGIAQDEEEVGIDNVGAMKRALNSAAEEEEAGIAEILGEKPATTKGVASILDLLRQRKHVEVEFYAGRANDKRIDDKDVETGPVSEKDGVFNINIEHLDEWGRKMTTKEAYRKFCSQWSGKVSGMNKQDKKIRKMKEQIRMEKMMSNSGIISKLNPIQRAQKTAHAPFVVLDSQRALNALKEVKDMTLSETLKPTSAIKNVKKLAS